MCDKPNNRLEQQKYIAAPQWKEIHKIIDELLPSLSEIEGREQERINLHNRFSVILSQQIIEKIILLHNINVEKHESITKIKEKFHRYKDYIENNYSDTTHYFVITKEQNYVKCIYPNSMTEEQNKQTIELLEQIREQNEKLLNGRCI